MSEPPPIEDYTIGWICAVQEEYEAACRMLDEEFDDPGFSEVNDANAYVFGRIGRHKVIIGCLPLGRLGTSSAATVAKDMCRTFPNLRFSLMVGIGGGAPTAKRDIRLGDVVVSVPYGKLGGVVQYDFGRRLSDGRFQQTGQLNSPPAVILATIPEMRRRFKTFTENLERVNGISDYQRPAVDQLYSANYEHNGGEDCSNCSADGLIKTSTT